jgi:hypothetical protein
MCNNSGGFWSFFFLSRGKNSRGKNSRGKNSRGKNSRGNFGSFAGVKIAGVILDHSLEALAVIADSGIVSRGIVVSYIFVLRMHLHASRWIHVA